MKSLNQMSSRLSSISSSPTSQPAAVFSPPKTDRTTRSATTLSSTWSREDFTSVRVTHMKKSKVLPVVSPKPKPSNDYCTPTKTPTSSFGMTALSQFGVIESNLETEECSYISVHSTDMSPTLIKTRPNPHMVYFRNEAGEILSYRRKLLHGRSNLGFKANRGKMRDCTGMVVEEPRVVFPLHTPAKRCSTA